MRSAAAEDAGKAEQARQADDSAHSTHSADKQDATASPGASKTKFEVPPLADGYLRYEAAPVPVEAKSSEDWAQWVGGPLDQDYDVLDITGMQSAGGHHALLYATPDANPAGFTRIWKDEDQFTTRLMGGIGGEGGASAKLPEGVVFRVKKGSYLVIQTHFLNPWDYAVVGRTVLDVKLSPVDPSRQVASIMSHANLTVDLPPGESTLDMNCEVKQDLRFLQISNHMHDYGKTTFSEFIDPSGEKHSLKTDKRWSGLWALSPNFTKFSLDAPMVVPAGSTLHTRCTWDNTTAEHITFPTEMCVFFGFILNESDIYCTDGRWAVAAASSPDDANADADPPNGDPASEEPGAPEMPEAAADAGSASGGCLGSMDRAIMDADAFDQQSTDCSIPCAFDPDVTTCTARCFRSDVGLSPACAACNATNVACGAKKCFTACLKDSASEDCRSCVESNCDPAFRMCAGL